MGRAALRQQISEYFNLDELKTICFDLGVDIESLSGQGREAKARELVDLFQRTSRITDLLAMLQAQRPDVEWEAAYQRPEKWPVIGKSNRLNKWVFGLLILFLAGALIILWRLGNNNNQGEEMVTAASTSEMTTDAAHTPSETPSLTTGLTSTPTSAPVGTTPSTPGSTSTEPANAILSTPTLNILSPVEEQGTFLEPTLIGVVSTIAGEEMQVSSLEIGQVYYSRGTWGTDQRFFGSTGIPLDNGVFVAFQYINSADFYKDSDGRSSVNIELIDGTIIDTKLGSIATTLRGVTSLGNFETSIENVTKIVVQQSNPIGSLPSSLPPGEVATIIYINDESVQIVDLVFNFSRIVHCSGLCVDTCYNYDVVNIPTLQGIVVELGRIKEVEFQIDQEVDDSENQEAYPMPVKITSIDGQVFMYDIAEINDAGEPYEPCLKWGLGSWWIKGKSILGDFAIPITSLHKISFSEQ
jgi:hypothetical protein